MHRSQMNRREVIAGAAEFAVAPLTAADGRKVKTPLMLDTKRMAIHEQDKFILRQERIH